MGKLNRRQRILWRAMKAKRPAVSKSTKPTEWELPAMTINGIQFPPFSMSVYVPWPKNGRRQVPRVTCKPIVITMDGAVL